MMEDAMKRPKGVRMKYCSSLKSEAEVWGLRWKRHSTLFFPFRLKSMSLPLTVVIVFLHQLPLLLFPWHHQNVDDDDDAKGVNQGEGKRGTWKRNRKWHHENREWRKIHTRRKEKEREERGTTTKNLWDETWKGRDEIKRRMGRMREGIYRSNLQKLILWQKRIEWEKKRIKGEESRERRTYSSYKHHLQPTTQIDFLPFTDFSRRGILVKSKGFRCSHHIYQGRNRQSSVRGDDSGRMRWGREREKKMLHCLSLYQRRGWDHEEYHHHLRHPSSVEGIFCLSLFLLKLLSQFCPQSVFRFPVFPLKALSICNECEQRLCNSYGSKQRRGMRRVVSGEVMTVTNFEEGNRNYQ